MNILLSLLSLGLMATVNGALTARIVGGTDAPDGKYPYMVAILDGRYFGCGGSILNKRYILTAGQCVKNKSPSDIRVIVGTTELTDFSIPRRKVEELIPHEEFVDFWDHDIGLIKLKEDIVFNEKIQPVKLPTSDNINSKFVTNFTGWGDTNKNRWQQYYLQQINLNVIPYNDCDKRMKASRQHICTYNKRGEGFCSGDAGGPLVAGEHQIGIASYLEPCGVGDPDVFTRVYSYLDWIEKHSRL